jgi:hypothetical protein
MAMFLESANTQKVEAPTLFEALAELTDVISDSAILNESIMVADYKLEKQLSTLTEEEGGDAAKEEKKAGFLNNVKEKVKAMAQRAYDAIMKVYNAVAEFISKQIVRLKAALGAKTLQLPESFKNAPKLVSAIEKAANALGKDEFDSAYQEGIAAYRAAAEKGDSVKFLATDVAKVEAMAKAANERVKKVAESLKAKSAAAGGGDAAIVTSLNKAQRQASKLASLSSKFVHALFKATHGARGAESDKAAAAKAEKEAKADKK